MRKRSSLYLACALACGMLQVGLQCASAAPNSRFQSASDAWVATATHAHPLRAGSNALGLANAGAPVHISVALKIQNRDLLDDFIANSRNPTHFFYRETLDPSDVVAEFSPDASQIQSVVNYLQDAGFSNISVAPNHMLISADGDAASVRTAFNARMVDVRKANGEPALANIDTAMVPARFGDVVLAVAGLQTESQPHLMIKPGPAPDGHGHGGGPGGGGGGGGGTVTGHNPNDFAAIYSAGGTPTGSGVTVGIISEGNMSATLSDLSQFTSSNGLPSVNVSTIYVGGQGTDTSGTAEWDLDSQDIVGMSGGVGSLVFYVATSLSDSALTQAYNRVVSDNTAKVINVSLGECERSAYSSGVMAADDQIFALAEAQGQTFSVSSGDSGSNECGHGRNGTGASYPASSPYVVSVGGTTLGTSGSGNTTWASEAAWASTGGSPSLYEPTPSWQTTVSDGYRGVPDIAFDADPNSGAIIIVNGSNAQYGGTSLSSPLFVGAWARALSGKSNLGFAGPHIYALPSGVYHDVTSGSNGSYSASAGWDYTTGFGSWIVSSAYSSL